MAPPHSPSLSSSVSVPGSVDGIRDPGKLRAPYTSGDQSDEELDLKADRDPLEQLAEAIDQTGAIIARIDPDQAALSTPCRSLDVRALVNHAVQDLEQFRGRAAGGPSERPSGDLIGDDWTAAYRQAGDALLRAWRREGALERTVELPFGTFPATWFVGQHIADIVVHGWDLAKATGQSTELDPELGRFALEWGRENLRPEFRGDESDGYDFAPEVPVPADAPIHDRLAGLFGRAPR